MYDYDFIPGEEPLEDQALEGEVEVDGMEAPMMLVMIEGKYKYVFSEPAEALGIEPCDELNDVDTIDKLRVLNKEYVDAVTERLRDGRPNEQLH